MPDKDKIMNFEAELNGVEIFSAGTWNGDKYTEADIQALADNFETLQSEVKPPLKLGHRELKGQPALGWIKKVYRVGKKLVADFYKIPDVVKKAIDAGGYRRVSAEIFPVFKTADGKQFKNVLAAVALLGAETPAVSNLADLAKLYEEGALPDGSGAGLKVYELSKEEIESGEHIAKQKDEGDKAMSDEKIKEFEAKLTAMQADLNDTKTALVTAQKERDEALAKVKEFEAKAETAAIEGHKKAFKEWLAGKVKAGEMSPAAAKVYEDNINDMVTPAGVVMKFEVVQKAEEAGKAAKQFKRGEVAHGVDRRKTEGKTIDGEAKKYAAEHKVDYQTAVEIVMRDNPELADDYIGDTTTINED